MSDLPEAVSDRADRLLAGLEGWPSFLRGRELTMSTAVSCRALRWRPVHFEAGHLLGAVTHAKPSAQKDGRMFFPGALKGHRRRNHDVVELCGLVLDCDSGQSFDDAIGRIERANFAYLGYTSYNHGARESRLKEKDVIAFANAGDQVPSDDDVRQYLEKRSGLWPTIAKSARIKGFTEQEGTRFIEIIHDPVHKFRIVSPLGRPFETGRYASIAQAQTAWRAFVEGFAASLGIWIDKACLDMSRAYYTPRHRPGGEYRAAVGGTTALVPPDPSVAPPICKTAPKITTHFRPRDVMCNDERRSAADVDSRVRHVLGQCNEDFTLFDLLEGLGWPIRRKVSENKWIIACPNEGEHSNPGDDRDSGCVIMRSDDGRGRTLITCRHAHCSDLKTPSFLEAILRERGSSRISRS